jgi:hypothetical protein
MRLFLFFILFNMIFRSMSVLYPWRDWARDLDMRRFPVRLSTRAEIAKLSERATPERPRPVFDDLMLSVDSLWDYAKPWPEAAVRAKMRGWGDLGKWSACWLCTRMEFFENLVGFDNEWPMFSPSVGKVRHVSRARLLYADGSERIVRTRGDPEDLTRFSHWFKEKILDHELKVREGEARADESLGFCNMLSHRYAENESGSPLVTIRLFVVRFDLAPPGADYREWYARLSEEPTRTYPDFYVYDVKTRHGKCLIEQHD